MKIKEIEAILANYKNKDDEILISLGDGIFHIGGLFRTVDRDDFSITAIVISAPEPINSLKP